MLSRGAQQKSTVTAETIRVEVVFALPDRQKLVTLRLPAGATVTQAIAESGLAADFRQPDLSSFPVAIWGVRARPEQLLRDKDRIEILRPLAIDPRDARRQLASKGQTMADRD